MRISNKFFVSMAAMLMAFAPIIPLNGSWLAVGEPKLPRKLKKDGSAD